MATRSHLLTFIQDLLPSPASLAMRKAKHGLQRQISGYGVREIQREGQRDVERGAERYREIQREGQRDIER